MIRVFWFLMLMATNLTALSISSIDNEEMIVSSDIIFVGEVIKIEPLKHDPKIEGLGQRYSNATVRIKSIFKGNYKAKDLVEFEYWSSGDNLPFSKPDSYKIGTTETFALSKYKKRNTNKFVWKNSFKAYYDTQLQSKDFLRLAKLFKEAQNDHKDPKTIGAAAYFLASQNRLDDTLLGNALENQEPRQLFYAIKAFQKQKNKITREKILEIAAKTNDSRLKFCAVEASKALLELKPPSNKEDYAKELLNLYSFGHDVSKYALTFKPRSILLNLATDKVENGSHNFIGMIKELSPHLAYELSIKKKHYSFLEGYQTIKAKEYILENPKDNWNYRSQSERLLKNFKYTDFNLNLLLIRDTREGDFIQLFNRAKEQLEVYKKSGPNFKLFELYKSLEKVIVYNYKTEQFSYLKKDEIKKFTNLIKTSIADKPLSNKTIKKPIYSIDFHAPFMSRKRLNHLIINAQGDFSFGELPDHTWGNSEALLNLLKSL